VAPRCLIVDDNAAFLVAARDLLERQGLDVAGTASTGAGALALAAEVRPDLALVDVGLGDESGFDLARRLVAEAVCESVVLISTYAENDLEELIAGSGAIGFVSKSDLSRATLEALVDGHGA
jgi:two-component system nitrate/nitrite response regulator NarL